MSIADQPDPRLGRLWAEWEARWPENRIEPTLARIRAVVDLLGEPQRAYPVIHVTGTNGKSSTARIIEALLRSYGLRTGLFTSPHLVDPRERICFDGRPIDADRLLATWDEVRPYIEVVDQRSVADGGVALSYFEVLTAVAFAAFADAPVDVAVIEVGLGGTWDSTNVADGAVGVITPIGLDHQEYLGDTLLDIAVEKAGILKPGAHAVLAQQELAVAEVLIERCVEVDATVAREGLEFGVLGGRRARGRWLAHPARRPSAAHAGPRAGRPADGSAGRRGRRGMGGPGRVRAPGHHAADAARLPRSRCAPPHAPSAQSAGDSPMPLRSRACRR